VIENNEIGKTMALMNDMARIQQAINRIREIGRLVNLSAINAGLAVRGVGSAGLGFSVAAQELRVFSVKMNAQTGVLSKNIGEVVNRTAHQLMATRHEILLRQAQEASQNKAMARALEMQSERNVLEHKAMYWSLTRLEKALHVVRLLATGGISLTRSARVEAAYAGTHTRRLTGVAQDMENAVTEILVLQKKSSDLLEARG
jgi:hypothetical protein